MKKLSFSTGFILTILFVSSHLNLIYAQYIPFLGKNGKYGYMDAKGILVVPTEYKDISPLPDTALYTTASKDGETGILFLNGFFVPGLETYNTYNARIYNYNNEWKNMGLLDIFVFPVGDQKICFVHLKKKIFKFYKNNLPRSICRSGQECWAPPPLMEFPFVNGLCKVQKDNNKYVLIDTTLQEVFPQAFGEGEPAPGGYFIVKNEDGGEMILDYTGKQISPSFAKIMKTEQEEYFIVCARKGHDNYSFYGYGLFHVDKKLVLDTTSSFISPIRGSKRLIQNSRESKNRIVNYEGETVFSSDSFMIFDNRFGNNVIIATRQSTFKLALINSDGKVLIDKDFNNVDFKYGWEIGSCLQLTHDSLLTLVDHQGKQMFAGKYLSFDFIGAYPAQILTSKKGMGDKNSMLKGVRDLEGEVVLKEIYEDIKQVKVYRDINSPSCPPDYPNFHFHIAKVKGLKGLFYKNGVELLPCQYEDINVQIYKSDTIVWLKKPSDKRWSAYDLRNKKLDYPDYHLPKVHWDNTITRGDNKVDGKPTIILSDGTTLPLPEGFHLSYPDFAQYPIKNGDVFVFAKKYKEHIFQVFDQRFNRISPEGYAPVTRFIEEERLTHTGLLPLYSITDPNDTLFKLSFNPWESLYVIEDTTISDSCYGYGGGKLLKDIIYKGPVRYCGVINIKGEWVLPPKSGVQYIPLSNYLVLERPFSYFPQEEFHFSRLPYKIHRVNQAEKGYFEVNQINVPFFKNERAIGMNRLENRSNYNFSTAYFDSTGRQITPFCVKNGPPTLSSNFHLTTIVDSSGSTRQVLLDRNGQIALDLWNYERPDLVFNKTIGYILAAKDKISGLWGMLDTNGKTILPFKYKALKILFKGKLISALDDYGNSKLMDLYGRTLMTSIGEVEYSITEMLNGFHVVSESNIEKTMPHITTILTHDFKVKNKYPMKCNFMLLNDIDQYSDEFNRTHFPNLILLGDSYENTTGWFWTDTTTGKLYRSE